MRKILLIISIICFLIARNVNSQTTEFWGLTSNDIASSVCNIFKTDVNGNNISQEFNFGGVVVTNEAHPYRSLISINTSIYGMTLDGGINNKDVLS